MFSSNYTNKDDASIWEDFKAGDRSALSYMYFRYAKLLMLYGRKISEDHQMVEDCIHDLFFELWKKRERLGSTDSIKFYLFKILRRKITESLRKKKDYISHEESHVSGFARSVENQIIDKQTDKERQSLVESLLLQLNDNQREIIHLKFYAGLKNREIADLLDMEHQSVKNVLFRTITKIRKYLQQHDISMPW
ncbi:sigma-70 family RNA polymerase sigma factor [Reichenbachiella sp. MALMAid0571]|uniref:RNA polymerase sigma factor n=1 Tax=Reichenbachiella sp. MALMAid0571 TaxID=3143939 RepID=UPI0032DFCE71